MDLCDFFLDIRNSILFHNFSDHLSDQQLISYPGTTILQKLEIPS